MLLKQGLAGLMELVDSVFKQLILYAHCLNYQFKREFHGVYSILRVSTVELYQIIPKVRQFPLIK